MVFWRGSANRLAGAQRPAPVLWLTVALMLGACAVDPVPPATIYGADLTPVDARHRDLAFVRDGIDFGRYDSLIIDRPALAFRPPDKSEREFPVTEAQKASLVRIMSEELARQFENSTRLKLVSEPMQNALLLEVRLWYSNCAIRRPVKCWLPP